MAILKIYFNLETRIRFSFWNYSMTYIRIQLGMHISSWRLKLLRLLLLQMGIGCDCFHGLILWPTLNFTAGKVKCYFRTRQSLFCREWHKLNSMTWIQHFMCIFIGRQAVIYFTETYLFNEMNFIEVVKHVFTSRNLFLWTKM